MGVELPLAYLLDLTWATRPHWPHPVRWLGRLIASWKPPCAGSFLHPRLAGLALTVICLYRCRRCGRPSPSALATSFTRSWAWQWRSS